MEIKPVEKIDPPAYPTGTEFAEAKGLLSAHLPRRWHKAKGLAGAVAVVLAANLSGGCGSDAGNNGEQTPSTLQDPCVSSRIIPPPSTSLLDDARDWVQSIFCQPQVQSGRSFIMGDFAVPLPRIKEDEIQGVIQSSPPPPVEIRGDDIKGVIQDNPQ